MRPHRLMSLATVLLVTEAVTLQAQTVCDDDGATALLLPIDSIRHPTPLDRRVTLRESGMPLGKALERLSATTGVRFSYSSDALALDRRVCVDFRDVPLADALAALLAGTAVEPKAVSSDHVALVPVAAGSPSGRVGDVDPVEAIALQPIHLEVDRKASATSAPTTASTVITRDQLTAQPTASIAALLNGAVPGLWLWDADGSSAHTPLVGMRGASSFGAGSPKVYLDGIELASPLALMRITAETVDYIEVISGPQGATLYGANATGGVIDIRTRHGSSPDGRPRVRLRGELGLGASPSVARLIGEQGVGVDLGTERTSARLDMSAALGEGAAGSDGPRRFAADLAGRLVGERSTVTLTARHLADRPAADPAARGSRWAIGGPAAFASRQTTAGLTAAIQPEGRWTHTLVAGVDAYAIEHPVDTITVIDASRLAITAAERGTLRLSSAGRFGLGRDSHALLRLAADHSLLRERSGVLMQLSGRAAGSRTGPGIVGSTALGQTPPIPTANTGGDFSELITANTGLGAQAELELRERLAVHGGLRFDRFGTLIDAGQWVVQPALGASWTNVRGPVSLTFRTAYGRAIRWLDPTTTQLDQPGAPPAVPGSTFEQQAGTEAGVDLRVGRRLDVHVTRFDQTASGLSQRLEVTVTQDSATYTPPSAGNVGQIDNRGWELQARLRHAALSINGALSLVDSRVARTAHDYAGELRPGDRMLNVPARLASLTVSWNARTWSALLTASQAADWIGYDEAALAASAWALPRGPALRDYWREYDRITLLGASAHRTLRPGLDLTIGAQDLLNARLATAYPSMGVAGRTVTAGFRLSF